MDTTSNSFDLFEILEKLAELRADFAIRHAIRGFNMDYETALEIIRNFDSLTNEEKDKRDILLAAIDNLVDFAVSEEYQMLCDIQEIEAGDEDEENEDEFVGDEHLKVFAKYNERFALVENKDIVFAMGIAAAWTSQHNDVLVTYLTMGDERVRPWHQDLDGITLPKREFPSWMIPPIEHACRCHLNYDHNSTRITSDKLIINNTPPEWANPIFKESVATGGRIFSQAHPYFIVNSEHYDALRRMSKAIKSKYI